MSHYAIGPGGQVPFDAEPIADAALPVPTATDVAFAPLYITYQNTRHDIQPPADLRRLKGRVTARDMHMPNATITRCARDVVLESNLFPPFRALEARYNLQQSHLQLRSMGGSGRLRMQHVSDHRASVGGEYTKAVRFPQASRGSLPLPYKVYPRDPRANFWAWASHPGAAGGDAANTRLTTVRVTAPTWIQDGAGPAVRTDRSAAHQTHVTYAPEQLQRHHMDGSITIETKQVSIRDELIMPRNTPGVSQWNSSVPITYVCHSLFYSQQPDGLEEYELEEMLDSGVGFPFDTIQHLDDGEPPIEVTLANGSCITTRSYLYYLVVNFCDGNAQNERYREVLRNIPVLESWEASDDPCLICFGNDLLDALAWSHHPLVRTDGLPYTLEPRLQQGALQLCPYGRPGQALLIACGDITTFPLKEGSPVLGEREIQRYKFDLGRQICFTGAPYRWGSVSVMNELFLFELHTKLTRLLPFPTDTTSGRAHMRVSTVKSLPDTSYYFCDPRPTYPPIHHPIFLPGEAGELQTTAHYNALAVKPVPCPLTPEPYPALVYRANSNRNATLGQAMRVGERQAREALQAGSPLFLTHGMDIGWHTAPRGGGIPVIVGRMPTREDNATIVCHPSWGDHPVTRPDLFWQHGDGGLNGALEGDVDWHPPVVWANVIAPAEVTSAYALEVAAAAAEASITPFPNYLI